MKMDMKYMPKMVKLFIKNLQKLKRYRYTSGFIILQYTARLKYIKSLYTELGKITDIVNRMAMSHPEIRISLVSDGKNF